jgi:cell division protein FtsB
MNNTYKIKAYKQRQKAVRAEIIITVITFAVMAVVGYNAIFYGCKWLCSIV